MAYHLSFASSHQTADAFGVRANHVAQIEKEAQELGRTRVVTATLGLLPLSRQQQCARINTKSFLDRNIFFGAKKKGALATTNGTRAQNTDTIHTTTLHTTPHARHE
jgi:hypothetical protein